MNDANNGVNKAIKAIGGVGKAAAEFNKTPEGVRLWRKSGVVPWSNVLKFERITGVPCYELNPEVYPPERFNPEFKKAS